MSEQQEEGVIPVIPVGGGGSVRLPPFWPHGPQLWFSQAECLFTVHNMSDQFHRYCLVVASLQHDSLRRVADIVEAPPSGLAYDTIKQCLLASHQMTGFQRAERLFAMPALGARKPSELMAEMLEICPHDEEKTKLFACLFLQRLPREIRVLLARVDHKDPKELVEQADHFWGLHKTPTNIVGGGTKEQLVAAVHTGAGSSRGHGGRGRHGGRGSGTASRIPYESELSREARLASGLCLKHWRYGEHANSCEQPCVWPGTAQPGATERHCPDIKSGRRYLVDMGVSF
jgi:hypothetical protein